MNLEIISKENKHYKELKKIINQKSDFIFIEGLKLLLEAKNSPLKIETVFVDKKNRESLPADINSEVIFLDNELISSLFTTDSKPEKEDLVIALARKPKYVLKELFETKKDLIFLERAQDPGNLGMIIRSTLAFNGGGVILSKDSVSPFNTKVVRASAGAVFSLLIETVDTFDDIKNLAKKYDYKLISTLKNSGKDIRDLDKNMQKVFLLGNEGRGLSESLINLSDETITIPQSNKVESLNLGVSASILLWESFRK